MDGKWSLPFKSTVHSVGNDALLDKFVEIFPEYRRLSNNARGLTTELVHRQSYCPATWTARAYNLLRLGFPDLAIGDAYKAIILLEIYGSQDHSFKAAVTKAIWRQTKESFSLKKDSPGMLHDKASRMRDYLERVRARSLMVFVQALFLANCFVECYEFLKCRPHECSTNEKLSELKELAERAQIMEDTSRLEESDFISSIDSQEARRSGSILPQVYPWSTPYISRSGQILNVARDNMRAMTSRKCYIEHSNIVDALAAASAVESESHVMGIKANRNFSKGQLLFVDRTFLSAIDDNTGRCSCCKGLFASHQLQENEAQCCNARFCGPTCKEVSKHYHFIDCNRPQDITLNPDMLLDQEIVSSDTIAANNLLYRVFAHLESYPTVHPLRNTAIGNMVPAYRNQSPVRFSWINDIKRPFTMLGVLGTDIFKDHGFDTWVIQTIQARIRNNVRAFRDEWGKYHMAINLLYMFFNHSCDPNVETVEHWSGSSHLFARATKAINCKDELFISYIATEDLERPYADRQALLKDWTGGECQCQRCRQERINGAEQQSTRSNSPETTNHVDDFSDEVYTPYQNSDTPENRYASDQALLELHPTIRSLQRTKALYDQRVEPFDYENDIDCGESPTKRKPRRGQPYF